MSLIYKNWHNFRKIRAPLGLCSITYCLQATPPPPPPQLSQVFNLRGNYLDCHVNAVSRKRLEIQAYSITKQRTLSE